MKLHLCEIRQNPLFSDFGRIGITNQTHPKFNKMSVRKENDEVSAINYTLET